MVKFAEVYQVNYVLNILETHPFAASLVYNTFIMKILEMIMVCVMVVFLVIVPLVLAFTLNKTKQQLKTILSIYFLTTAFLLIGLLTLLGLM